MQTGFVAGICRCALPACRESRVRRPATCRWPACAGRSGNPANGRALVRTQCRKQTSIAAIRENISLAQRCRPMSDETIVWSEPVGPLRISDEETHVWRTTLDWPATGVDALSRTLSAEELARVDRLHRQTRSAASHRWARSTQAAAFSLLGIVARRRSPYARSAGQAKTGGRTRVPTAGVQSVSLRRSDSCRDFVWPRRGN